MAEGSFRVLAFLRMPPEVLPRVSERLWRRTRVRYICTRSTLPLLLELGSRLSHRAARGDTECDASRPSQIACHMSSSEGCGNVPPGHGSSGWRSRLAPPCHDEHPRGGTALATALTTTEAGEPLSGGVVLSRAPSLPIRPACMAVTAACVSRSLPATAQAELRSAAEEAELWLAASPRLEATSVAPWACWSLCIRTARPAKKQERADAKELGSSCPRRTSTRASSASSDTQVMYPSSDPGSGATGVSAEHRTMAARRVVTELKALPGCLQMQARRSEVGIGTRASSREWSFDRSAEARSA
mmetsp:Transcript_12906/g.36307  ORF Transcript_12906/g.36307 Transcript_12906/m.36307 type:complete len:301 (-) Transcript_12906:555-1457(-)